ncbi:MAG: glycosyltransferase family 87 protein [Candidatus Sulfotelmatobacter sp.]
MSRNRLKTWIAVLIVGMLCIHGVLFFKARVLIRQGYPDFTIFYTAGKMLREGLRHNLYDGALQYEVQQTFAAGVRIRKGPLPYNHPPFEALIFEPLASLDYPTAYLVWSAINLAILGLLPFLLRRYIPVLAHYALFVWLLVLLGFFPVLVALLQGQDVILLLLLNALAFAALKRNADTLAGCWLGLSVFKFQLILPLVLILLCWKRSRVVQSFVVTAAVMASISVAITGWAGALRYPWYVLHFEKFMERGGIAVDMPNLRGLLEGWSFSGFPGSHVITIALSIGLLVWVSVKGRSRTHSSQRFHLEFDLLEFDLQFSLAMVAAVLASYHAFPYDLSLLVIPVLLVVNYAIETASLQRYRNWALMLPVGLLFLTPIYMLLWIRLDHFNLFATVLLLWMWGIAREISSRSESPETQRL